MSISLNDIVETVIDNQDSLLENIIDELEEAINGISRAAADEYETGIRDGLKRAQRIAESYVSGKRFND